MQNGLIELENELINNYYMGHLGDGEVDLAQCAVLCHRRLIVDLAYTFLCERVGDNAGQFVADYFITDGYKPQFRPFYAADEIPELCEQLQIMFLSSGFKKRKNGVHRVMSKEYMTATGAVYTRKEIARQIVSETLDNVRVGEDVRVLDFACGTGRFYCCVVDYLVGKGVELDHAVRNCVHAKDIDPVAVNITRLKACSMLSEISGASVADVARNIELGNALVCDANRGLFSQTEEMTFDAIVSNPPYLVLKPSHNTSSTLAEEMKKQVQYYRTSGQYHYAVEGMLNLYQISIERMLQMLKPKGELGVICPATLFADQSATRLRKHLLVQNKVRRVIYFPEGEDMFENNVTQATNIFYLQKGEASTGITVGTSGGECIVDLSTIRDIFPQNMEIPMMAEIDWAILRKISALPKLKELPQIRNKRGELDLTLNAQYITNEATGHHLVRGKMVTAEGIDRSKAEYVSDAFVDAKSAEYRQYDYGRVRLVGQNICNIDNHQRLRFAFCEPTDIIGNSCNYLSSELDTLKKLKILLSSALLNWRFRITSSNNHINNYELDELPIVGLDKVDGQIKFPSQDRLDEYVCSLYGLTVEETQYICGR